MTITAEMLENEDYSSLKDGNFSVVIADDISMTGYINAKAYRDELKNINAEKIALNEKYNEDEISYKEYEEQWKDIEVKEVKALNDNSSIILVSKSQEKKLANVIFEADIESYPSSWGDVTYYYVETATVFEFGDKTKVDAEVYFSKGFDKVLSAIDNLLKKFGYVEEEDVAVKE